MDALHPADVIGLHASTLMLPNGAGVFGDLAVSPLDAVTLPGAPPASSSTSSTSSTSGTSGASSTGGGVGAAIRDRILAALVPGLAGIEGVLFVVVLVVLGILFVGLGAYIITKD